MTAPDPEEVSLRLRAVQLRMLAGMATMAAGAADMAVAAGQLARAWREAERHDINETLWEHPDLVEADMDAARWWDTP